MTKESIHMLTVEGTAVKGVVFMNRIFKVIFNRNRQLVQVVPEYAKNRGKDVSESGKGEYGGWPKSCSPSWPP